MTDRRPTLAVAVAAMAAGLAAVPAARATTSPTSRPFGFAPAVYVDNARAGGEPVVIAHHCPPVAAGCVPTLIYTSHAAGETTANAGTVPVSPGGDKDMATTNREQTFIWTSTDNGQTWTLEETVAGSGITANPAYDRGFSDPDLTEDEGGRVYAASVGEPAPLDTTYMFSSPDGGRSFDQGAAPLCELGDRPWIAGGRTGEAWLSTEGEEVDGVSGVGALSHAALYRYQAADPTRPCSTASVPIAGAGWSGGPNKIVFEHQTGAVLVPIQYDGGGLGVAQLDAAQQRACFAAAGACVGFAAHKMNATGVDTTPFTGGVQDNATLAVDAADTWYLTWADKGSPLGPPDDATPTQSACNAAAQTVSDAGDSSALTGPWRNHINIAVSRDRGSTWRSWTLADTGTSVLKPWVVAGGAGKVAVAWYQSNRAVNLDCDPSDISVKVAFIFDADQLLPETTTVDPVGEPIHQGTMCMQGTFCAALSPAAPELDRRLGEVFTAAIDQQGCVLVATGDTRLPDPITGALTDPRTGAAPQQPTSRPLFIRQNAGPSLTAGKCNQ